MSPMSNKKTSNVHLPKIKGPTSFDMGNQGYTNIMKNYNRTRLENYPVRDQDELFRIYKNAKIKKSVDRNARKSSFQPGYGHRNFEPFNH